MITADHIEKAIEKTLRGESNLTDDMLNVRGFSTPCFRKLINNLTNFECSYLEVGLLCGATFVSSFNKDCLSVGIEDFSQDFNADIPNYGKDELQGNVDKFSERAKEVHVHYESFLEINKDVLPKNIDIYLFDGEHGIQNQSVALPEFFDNMAHRFIYVVDDCKWPQVIEGTGVGFKFLRKKMWLEKTWELGKDDETFGNGVNIYLISKK